MYVLFDNKIFKLIMYVRYECLSSIVAIAI